MKKSILKTLLALVVAGITLLALSSCESNGCMKHRYNKFGECQKCGDYQGMELSGTYPKKDFTLNQDVVLRIVPRETSSYRINWGNGRYGLPLDGLDTCGENIHLYDSDGNEVFFKTDNPAHKFDTATELTADKNYFLTFKYVKVPEFRAFESSDEATIALVEELNSNPESVYMWTWKITE